MPFSTIRLLFIVVLLLFIALGLCCCSFIPLWPLLLQFARPSVAERSRRFHTGFIPSFAKESLRVDRLRILRSVLLPGLLAAQAGNAAAQAGRAPQSPATPSPPQIFATVPDAFEENGGQLAPETSFLGRAQSYSVAINRDRLRFFIPSSGAGSTMDVTVCRKSWWRSSSAFRRGVPHKLLHRAGPIPLASRDRELLARQTPQPLSRH